MWYRKWVLSVIILVFMTLTPSAMYADSPSSAALPPLDKLFEGQNTNEYIKYWDNYSLDTIDASMFSAGEQFGNLVNGLANVMFLVQVYIGYMLITTFYYAFELDIYGMLSGVMQVFVHEMKTSIFDELSLIAILFLGVYFIVKVVQNQKTQVWVAIIQTAIIVAFAIYFFTNPLQALQQVDNATKEISRSVLSGTYKATNDGATPNSAVMAAANNIWYIYVHQPWQMLEFGNIEMAKKEEWNILKNGPASEERKEYIKKLAEDGEHFTPSWGYKRLGLILLYFIPIAIIFVVIIVMCLLMLAYQLLTILFTLFGVFIFIMALIPFFGLRLLQNWLAKVISYATIKIIVCFCLGIMLSFISAIFKVSDQSGGWLVTMLLEVVVVLVVIWKKDELFEFFTFMRLASQNPSMVNKQLRRDTNVESKVNDFMVARMNGSGFRKSKSNDEAGEKESSKEVKRSHSKQDINNKEVGTEKAEKLIEPKDSDQSTNEKSKSEKKKTDSGKTDSKAKEKSKASQSVTNRNSPSSEPSYNRLFNEMSQDQSEDNNNFRQLMKKAEDILQKQYEISKMESESKAEKLKKEPEYSTFVQKVDTREAMGAPRFEQREVVAVAQNLQRIVDSGGRPEDLLAQNKNNNTSTAENRPKDVISLVVNGQQQNVNRSEAYRIILEDASKEYTREFNQDYGKKYDDKFMEGLIKQYGQQNVRTILNKMKDIREKEGSIKNPAGYLTQSLKNNSSEGGGMRGKGDDRAE